MKHDPASSGFLSSLALNQEFYWDNASSWLKGTQIALGNVWGFTTITKRNWSWCRTITSLLSSPNKLRRDAQTDTHPLQKQICGPIPRVIMDRFKLFFYGFYWKSCNFRDHLVFNSYQCAHIFSYAHVFGWDIFWLFAGLALMIFCLLLDFHKAMKARW